MQAEINQAERDAIKKYKLEDDLLYMDGDRPVVDANNPLSVLGGMLKSARIGKLRVRDLVDGKTFENDDIGGMLATEAQIKEAAENLKTYLDVAASFGGREVIEL